MDSASTYCVGLSDHSHRWNANCSQAGGKRYCVPECWQPHCAIAQNPLSTTVRWTPACCDFHSLLWTLSRVISYQNQGAADTSLHNSTTNKRQQTTDQNRDKRLFIPGCIVDHHVWNLAFCSTATLCFSNLLTALTHHICHLAASRGCEVAMCQAGNGLPPHSAPQHPPHRLPQLHTHIHITSCCIRGVRVVNMDTCQQSAGTSPQGTCRQCVRQEVACTELLCLC